MEPYFILILDFQAFLLNFNFPQISFRWLFVGFKIYGADFVNGLSITITFNRCDEVIVTWHISTSN